MKRRGFFGGLAALFSVPAARGQITIYNNGATIQQVRERGPTGEEQIRLIVRQAAYRAQQQVASGIAGGSGATARALRSRGR